MMTEFWVALNQDGAFWKLILAIVLGGVIGLEREAKGRPAGLRTHALVCLGSTILMVAARNASHALAGSGDLARMAIDPERIAAGIVTGIGFLGAGAILRTGDLIRGLTTGATIWFVAALGIVIGDGFYPLATVSALTVVLVLEVFDVFEHRIPPVVYRSLRLGVTLKDHRAVDAWCREYLHGRRVRIQETLCGLDSVEQTAEMTFRIRARASLFTPALAEEIGAQPGVKWVRMESEWAETRP
jgi:putative Mg2+ transporter-C (MgtC) family protein